jgi:hypothetical protein
VDRFAAASSPARGRISRWLAALRAYSARMKRTSRVMLALAFPLWLAGCDRNNVTSTERVPQLPAPAEPLSAPVALPDMTFGGRPLAAFSEEESVKFEAWCKRHGLDPKDPAMLDADSDRDGFSNREEYIAGTNPLDPNSVPGILDGIVMKEFNEVRVPVLLREVKDGKARIEHLDSPGTEELQQGAVLKGLPYRIAAVKHEVKADKHGIFSDVSQVTLENVDTKESVVLIRDLPSRSSATHAVIIGADGARKMIHADEVIELPGHVGKKFKVLELRPEQVVIEEMGTRRPLTIPKR